MLVVTGASGLLGATVLRSAVDLGWEALGICHRHVLRDSAVQVAAFDLTDESAATAFFLQRKPDAIIHCAAASNVDWCENNPKQAEAINVNASASLAGIAAKINARFLYISTDSVFDGKKGNYEEADQPAPLNVYARSKLAGEHEVLRANPAASVARVNIYGWNAQNKDSLAEMFLKRLEEGIDVQGFTDVFSTPILVNDLAAILFAMVERKLTGIYHVAGSERISKFDFGRRVATTFGFDPARITPCKIEDAHLKAARPLDVSLRTAKISAALGCSMPDVDSGLTKFRELRDVCYPQQLKNYLLERTYR